MPSAEPARSEDSRGPDVKFEYWRSSLNRLWYWHLKTSDNEKLAQGEAYPTREECLRAIERVRGSSGAALQDLTPGQK